MAHSIHLRSDKVGYGLSNSEILAASTCFPLCPQQRTSSDIDVRPTGRFWREADIRKISTSLSAVTRAQLIADHIVGANHLGM